MTTYCLFSETDESEKWLFYLWRCSNALLICDESIGSPKGLGSPCSVVNKEFYVRTHGTCFCGSLARHLHGHYFVFYIWWRTYRNGGSVWTRFKITKWIIATWIPNPNNHLLLPQQHNRQPQIHKYYLLVISRKSKRKKSYGSAFQISKLKEEWYEEG